MWMKFDVSAGLTVFFVALPLCLGIALASGAPLMAGIASGIIGGVVVSFISGSQLAVSGPAAGLSTVVAASILSLGDYRVFLLAVIVAGLFQIVLGLLKLGTVSNYFPSSVIKGMLAAIGIILLSKQIPIAIGYDQPDFWTSGFLRLFSRSNIFNNLQNFNHHITLSAIIISVSAILVLLFLQNSTIKKLKILPAPLVVVVLGIGINYLFQIVAPAMALRQSQMVNIPGNILASFSFPDFNQVFTRSDFWQDGLIIGLLASLETLLCIEAVDKLDPHNRITPVNRELIAQGIGNVLCGAVGAIPITSVVVRGAANIDAGAKTRLSSFTHGVFLLLSVVAIPYILNAIPLSTLSVVLIITGFNLTKPKLYRHMWSLGLKQFLPFAITILVILSTDLLIGVSIGLLISIYFIVQNNFKAEYAISKKVIQGIETEYIKLNSNVTFLNKVNLRDTLENVPEYSVLTIDGSECNFIDYDILEIITDFRSKAHDRHIELNLIGITIVQTLEVH